MKAGRVALYDENDNRLKSKYYAGTWELKIILSEWKKQYGGGYQSCYLQYEPYADETLVDRTGGNCRKNHKPPKGKKVFAKTYPVKPPPVYYYNPKEAKSHIYINQ